MAKRRILLIDDEVDFCKLVKKNLEAAGNFRVDIATRGEKGIDLAKKTKPNLILLDIVMPGMNGVEVLKGLKKDEDTMKIPVVMLTAKEDAGSIVEAMQSGTAKYITKPIDTQGLKEEIENILGGKS